MSSHQCALTKVINLGLLEDGALLMYRPKGGELKAIGKARRDGVEVAGHSKLMTFGAFEAYAKSALRRATGNMYTAKGRILQELIIEATRIIREEGDIKSAAQPSPDGNDDVCSVCCLGGEDLLCCETCPAVFHLECLGLSAMPAEEQWHCSACVCAACSRPSFDNLVQPQCPVHWIMAQPQVVPGSVKVESATNDVKAEAARDWDTVVKSLTNSPELVSTSGLIPLQDRNQLPPSSPPDAGASGLHVRSPLSCRRYHVQCLSQRHREQLGSNSAVWFPSDGERQVAQRLASVAAAGPQMTQPVPGQGHMSWQIIRGAAVMPTARSSGSPRAPDGSSSPRASAAASEGCRGFAPSYNAAQQGELQRVLSAVRAVFEEAYDPVIDRSSGLQVLPLLISGHSTANREADFSGFYTAVLWIGTFIVSVAVFRAFDNTLAEIPFLATRPQSQGLGFGRLLLTQIEDTLAQAGVAAATMPAWITAAGDAAMDASAMPMMENGRASSPTPWPTTSAAFAWACKMGYQLPASEERLVACRYPIVRGSATLLLAKSLRQLPLQQEARQKHAMQQPAPQQPEPQQVPPGQQRPQPHPPQQPAPPAQVVPQQATLLQPQMAPQQPQPLQAAMQHVQAEPPLLPTELQQPPPLLAEEAARQASQPEPESQRQSPEQQQPRPSLAQQLTAELRQQQQQRRSAAHQQSATEPHSPPQQFVSLAAQIERLNQKPIVGQLRQSRAKQTKVLLPPPVQAASHLQPPPAPPGGGQPQPGSKQLNLAALASHGY